MRDHLGQPTLGDCQQRLEQVRLDRPVPIQSGRLIGAAERGVQRHGVAGVPRTAQAVAAVVRVLAVQRADLREADAAAVFRKAAAVALAVAQVEVEGWIPLTGRVLDSRGDLVPGRTIAWSSSATRRSPPSRKGGAPRRSRCGSIRTA